MSKEDILHRVVNIHNILSQIMVNGDSAIMMAQALTDMRNLTQEILADLRSEDENAEQSDE